MSFSPRLPIYGLLIGAFIPARAVLGGLLGLQGLVLTGVYTLGIVTAMLVSATLQTALPKRPGRLGDAPFVLELPAYRLPSLVPILRSAASRSMSFVTRAAPVIFGVTIAVWALGYFPGGAGHLEQSWLASIGKLLAPLLHPIGADWKVAVGVLTSFVAREVFVGTLGTLYGLEANDGGLQQLSTALPHHGMTIATGMALMAFYALSLQCASTLAVMRKETGSIRIPVMAFLGMTTLAYSVACVVFQLVRHLS
jgi:ferrous iron transport protein B